MYVEPKRVSQVNSDYMSGVINLLRRQLCVFLHVWDTLSFQVREYEEREEHFDLQADEDRKGIGRG